MKNKEFIFCQLCHFIYINLIKTFNNEGDNLVSWKSKIRNLMILGFSLILIELKNYFTSNRLKLYEPASII